MTPELEKLLKAKKGEYEGRFLWLNDNKDRVYSKYTIAELWDFISQSLAEAHNNAIEQAIKVCDEELLILDIVDEIDERFEIDKIKNQLKALEIK